MELRKLGNSGTLVSALGLGTMTFGNETDETEAHRQLDVFVDAGGTFIDTADVYQRGESEEIVGKWIANRGGHGDLVIATKGRFTMSEDLKDRGAGRRHLMRAIEASLTRLQVDHVDLYQVHAWDPMAPIEETLGALTSIVESGMARHVGWSNVTGWQLQLIIDLCERNGWSPPITLQPQYNLLDRMIEVELVPACMRAGIGLLPWSPLGGGWLSGKYQRDTQPTGATRLGEDPDRGVEAYDPRNTDRTWAILDVVAEIAHNHDASMAQVALAWVRERPMVSSVLLGARTVEQLTDNLSSATVALSDGETARLTEISAPGLAPYPYGFLHNWCGVEEWHTLGTTPA